MAKEEFTASQVMALQERLEKRIEVIAEQYGGLSRDVKEMKPKLDQVVEDLIIIKLSLPNKADKKNVDELDPPVSILETKIA